VVEEILEQLKENKKNSSLTLTAFSELGN